MSETSLPPVAPAPAAANRQLRHSATIGLVALLLGFLLVATVNARAGDADLGSASQSDLVVLLDSLSGRLARLQAEQLDLLTARNEILQGTDAEALAATRDQLFAMQVLAGSVPVQGEGVELTVTDPKRRLTYDTVLALVQELRDAGAEAIEINGHRVGMRTAFGQTSTGLSVDGKSLTLPLRVLAVGPSQTLQVAMQMPGGVGDTVAGLGGRLTVADGPVVILSTVKQ